MIAFVSLKGAAKFANFIENAKQFPEKVLFYPDYLSVMKINIQLFAFTDVAYLHIVGVGVLA